MHQVMFQRLLRTRCTFILSTTYIGTFSIIHRYLRFTCCAYRVRSRQERHPFRNFSKGITPRDCAGPISMHNPTESGVLRITTDDILRFRQVLRVWAKGCTARREFCPVCPAGPGHAYFLFPCSLASFSLFNSFSKGTCDCPSLRHPLTYLSPVAPTLCFNHLFQSLVRVFFC